MHLDTLVSQLHRVGHTIDTRLKNLGIYTVRDLLWYFPFRYEDFSQIVPIAQLHIGAQVTVCGQMEMIATKRSPRKHLMITEAVVTDESGRLRVVWFGQPFLSKTLKVGETVYLSGKVGSDMIGIHMVSPVYERLTASTITPVGGGMHTARIVPLYPLTSGLTQKQLRFLMTEVIAAAAEIEEWLPEDLRKKAEVMPLAEAIKKIHFPESDEEQKAAERRLKFDELFLLQLRSVVLRKAIRGCVAPTLAFHEEHMRTFVQSLPWPLTKGQKIAAWEILQDMARPIPMNRLLEGDVGSGKTVVAAMAMAETVTNGHQAVFMAPTEILAAQHYASLVQLFAGKDMTLALLTRTMAMTNTAAETRENKTIANRKRNVVQLIADGHINVIIGTHALLSEDIHFQKLGLVIVDEQHRFGVAQRKLIHDKSGEGELVPHFLSMTATPIPRSLALTLYGDLDISMIREMPAGRKPIVTTLVSPHQREKMSDFIREQVRSGRQVFVVCPLIDESDVVSSQAAANSWMGGFESEKKSVLSEYKKLSEKIFPDLRVQFLHGKMKAKEKEAVMKKFTDGEIDILVATSVIEVGVNIPNASVMMIEGADRFGLAQLHQFRGRVGRSVHQSYCFLFTDNQSARVQKRLEYFSRHTDGFALAAYDLEERGPGEVYGTTQSGMMQLKLASMRDLSLMKLARDLAQEIDITKYPLLKEKIDAWERQVHLE